MISELQSLLTMFYGRFSRYYNGLFRESRAWGHEYEGEDMFERMRVVGARTFHEERMLRGDAQEAWWSRRAVRGWRGTRSCIVQRCGTGGIRPQSAEEVERYCTPSERRFGGEQDPSIRQCVKQSPLLPPSIPMLSH